MMEDGFCRIGPLTVPPRSRSPPARGSITVVGLNFLGEIVVGKLDYFNRYCVMTLRTENK